MAGRRAPTLGHGEYTGGGSGGGGGGRTIKANPAVTRAQAKTRQQAADKIARRIRERERRTSEEKFEVRFDPKVNYMKWTKGRGHVIEQGPNKGEDRIKVWAKATE